MNLIKNLAKTEFGIEGEVFFRLYGTFIGLTIDEESNVEFAQKCAALLNNLSRSVVDHLCRASERYCNDFLYEVGEPLIEFKTNRAVLDRIEPGALIVPKPNEIATPVVHMELDCDWEEEHGMEWLIRDNTVLYVGGFNGCYEYDTFKGRDSWNYAWQTVNSG